LKQYEIDASIPLTRDSNIPALNFGISNFDSIGTAYLAVFQCTTLEGWSHIMMMIEDGFNPYISKVFFISCIIICSYFLLNLTVAVMFDKFKRLMKKQNKGV
jgi:hypothetical protein